MNKVALESYKPTFRNLDHLEEELKKFFSDNKKFIDILSTIDRDGSTNKENYTKFMSFLREKLGMFSDWSEKECVDFRRILTRSIREEKDKITLDEEHVEFWYRFCAEKIYYFLKEFTFNLSIREELEYALNNPSFKNFYYLCQVLKSSHGIYFNEMLKYIIMAHLQDEWPEYNRFFFAPETNPPEIMKLFSALPILVAPKQGMLRANPYIEKFIGKRLYDFKPGVDVKRAIRKDMLEDIMDNFKRIYLIAFPKADQYFEKAMLNDFHSSIEAVPEFKDIIEKKNIKIEVFFLGHNLLKNSSSRTMSCIFGGNAIKAYNYASRRKIFGLFGQ